MHGPHTRRAITLGALGLGAATGLLAVAPSGLADQSSPTYNCRASALRIENTLPLPVPTIEPVLANGSATGASDRAACADDDGAVVPQITESTPVVGVDLTTPAATTRLTPDLGAARDQEAASGATIADATITLGGGALTLKASALQAIGDAKCVAGVPTLAGTSSIGSLSINGMAIDLNGPVTTIATAIDATPLSGLVQVLPNQKLETTNAAGQKTLTSRALEVRVLSALGSPLATVVLGEAKVSADGTVCAPASTPPTQTETTTQTTTVTTPAPPPTTTPGTTTPGGTTPGGGTNGSGTNGTGTNGSGTGSTSGSDTGAVKDIVLNGRNGGCGRLTSISFVKNKKRTVTSRFGSRQVVRGRLISCTGKSIVGARLDVTHLVGSKKLVKTGLRSRAAGRITLILPSNLTTRRIRFSYRGNLSSAKVTSSRTLTLKVVNRAGRPVTTVTKK